jgi:hypothetical protein
MQPYSNQNRRNMEDDLNIFENGRQPQVLFVLRKMTSIYLKMEDELKKNNVKKPIKSKKNNIFEIGR